MGFRTKTQQYYILYCGNFLFFNVRYSIQSILKEKFQSDFMCSRKSFY